MKTSRRTFIRRSTLAIAGTAVLPHILSSCSGQKGTVGLQLYCIRDEMEADPLGSLKQIAAMGWKYVEHANYVERKFYGWTPADFRKVIDDLGLKMISGHTVMGSEHWNETTMDFSDSWKWTIEDAAVMGQKYVVSPWMDESMRTTYDDFMRYMEVFNKCGELCQKNGMKFGYHNHDFEFSQQLNGKKLFDIMMTSIDPDKVVIQLDTGNMYSGGGVALDVVNQYPGRFENLHVKDVIRTTGETEGYESCVLGEGIVNIKEVTDLATKIGGTEVYIIEQESYQGRTPMECMKKNLAVMQDWGYC